MRSIVYYYTLLQRSFAASGALLAGDPTLWLPAPAEPLDGGWSVTLHADGPLPRALADHRAIVTVGPSSTSEGTVLRSISWRSSSSDRFIPALEADLSLTCLNGSGCQLSLMGSYRPPLAVAGAAGDRLVGHRVAEAAVRRFVLELADRLDASLQQV
jgi:hypothetical protein